MRRTFLLALALALAVALGAAPLAARAESLQTPVAANAPAPPTGGAGPLVAPADPAAPAALPAGPLDGALFMDDECEAACFQQYFECVSGCSACDQCSCELAYCRSGCGVPFTGC